jgi:hypothetical protein
MKKIGWQIKLGLLLLVSTALLYLLHYYIFRDAYHIFLYSLGDLAFLPIEVLLVTLVIHGLLDQREKRQMLNKLNMVIGVFFSEVGISLIKQFKSFDTSPQKMEVQLLVDSNWTERTYRNANKAITMFEGNIDSRQGNLAELRAFLLAKRDFMLRLLENPNLLEHETFTELLWGVFHLAEELVSREDFNQLPDADYAHLSKDIHRVYIPLLCEWLAYMQHLQISYPYLFSLAVRTNPFDTQAQVEIQK